MSRRAARRSTDLGTCRDCGRQIRWAHLIDSGKPVALDPSPVEGGTVELFQGKATVLPPGRGLQHQMHHVSCPTRVRSYA